MPVTKTAKRALRSSKKKEEVNKVASVKLSVAIRVAEKKPSSENINKAISLLDRASKTNFIHKNKASRLKSRLSKLGTITKTSAKVKKTKPSPKPKK